MFRKREGSGEEETEVTYSTPYMNQSNGYGEGRHEAAVAEPLPRLFDVADQRTGPATLQRSVTPEQNEPDESDWSEPVDLPIEEPEAVFSEGINVVGKLSFKRFVRIDGSFEGEIDSDGKMVVGPTGVVKSNLCLREAIIEGHVEGNIVVKDRLELRGEAKVIGDIQAKLLSIDEGVTIVGRVCVKPFEDGQVIPSTDG